MVIGLNFEGETGDDALIFSSLVKRGLLILFCNLSDRMIFVAIGPNNSAFAVMMIIIYDSLKV